MAGTRRGRSGRFLISGLLVGVVGLASVGLNTDLSSPPRYDGAGYAVLGLALSTGRGYREIHTPARALHAHYPPGYPLALGMLWRVTGRSARSAHAFSVACTVGAILAAWIWFRTMFREAVALAGGLALAVNWAWARQGGAIQSEPLYFLEGQLALLAGVSAARRGGVGRGLVLGVVLGACVLTRHVGATLALAIGLELLRRRRLVSLGAVVGSAIVLVLPWVIWLATSKRSTQVELFQGDDLPSLVLRQAVFYARRIPDQLVGPVVEIGTVFARSAALFAAVNAWAILATGLIACGWWRALGRPRTRLAGLVPLTTLPLLLAWPFTEAGRFLLPLVPCLIVGAIEGLAGVARRVGLGRPRSWAAGAVLLASLPYPAYSLVAARAEAHRRLDRIFDEAADWIARHGDRPGPILTSHPAELYWLTGREGLGPESDDTEDLARSVDRLGVAYILVDDHRYARAPASPIGRYVREHSARVREVWARESGETAVALYEVRRPGR